MGTLGCPYKRFAWSRPLVARHAAPRYGKASVAAWPSTAGPLLYHLFLCPLLSTVPARTIPQVSLQI